MRLADKINPRLLRRFQPLPAHLGPAESAAVVDLGRMLFFDARLSVDGQTSCDSCHDLDRYGVDGKATSTGFHQHHGKRNSPTVYNAAGFFSQFWDGRVANVEAQAKEPILNPDEMAMPDAAHVVKAVAQIPGYVGAFRRAFPAEESPITYDNVGRAIGAFERGLVTPGRWDRFLAGDERALSGDEKVGLKTFLDVGCVVCHTGPFLGGSMFERLGAVEPWPNQTDKGRGQFTHRAADDMMFKVPTLRNVAKTAPYFHDGSAQTLDDAIRLMGKHQLGLELTSDEVKAIGTWLGSLTGEIPAAYVKKPLLPDAR